MEYMFSEANVFNTDVSRWNVSRAKDMDAMFQNTSIWNDDLSAWDVSRVQTMHAMFSYTDGFDGDVSAWNVGQVKGMVGVFTGAAALTDCNRARMVRAKAWASNRQFVAQYAAEWAHLRLARCTTTSSTTTLSPTVTAPGAPSAHTAAASASPGRVHTTNTSPAAADQTPPAQHSSDVAGAKGSGPSPHSSKPADSDPCNAILCALDCSTDCGWSQGESKCVTGAQTTMGHIRQRLGDCPHIDDDDDAGGATSGSYGGGGASLGMGVLALVAIAVLGSVAVCVYRRNNPHPRQAASKRYQVLGMDLLSVQDN